MQSLKELYKIGHGPSSSHTMGPAKAMKTIMERAPEADSFKVILFGSLALTGKGHMTDKVICETANPKPVDIIFDTSTIITTHPNTMIVTALKNGKVILEKKIFSVGGGSISFEGEEATVTDEVYPQNSFTQIKEHCKSHNIRLWQYVQECEGEDVFNHLVLVWSQMKRAIEEGLCTDGVLWGGLDVHRKAGHIYNQRHIDESTQTRENRIVCAYAFAVSEQSAAGGLIVTAPTCGASGVLPAVLKYMQDYRGFSDEEIIKALAAGGVIGNLIKTNASISGAECGCQAEIGTACSMAAAALGELFQMGIDQIEYAAEVAMEHHLGLTCDPIDGLVQIPCIERNAVAAMRAINALSLANFLAGLQKISFDTVVKTMNETGRNISSAYRETSEGGLAKHYDKNSNQCQKK